MSEPAVSIVIVNTNEERYLIPCLESLQKHESALSREVIVVDNHSSGDINALLQSHFPDVHVIRLNENSGFCKANNAALRHARGKYVLLLNPDTLLQENCISSCIEYFEKKTDKKVAAIGCRLLNSNGSLQKSFFRSASSIRKTLQGNSFFIKLFGSYLKKKDEEKNNRLHAKTGSAPWLCGAFLMMSRKIMVRENFLLDEDFFLYSDDTELGYRIRNTGYRLIYYPETSIIHLGGGSMPVLKKFEQLTISEWLCMMKIHGKFYFICNQILLLTNFFWDEFFFRNKSISHNMSIEALRGKIIRKKTWLLWKQFTFVILLRYKRKMSSSKEMLKYIS